MLITITSYLFGLSHLFNLSSGVFGEFFYCFFTLGAFIFHYKVKDNISVISMGEPITNTCCMRHPLCPTVEGQGFLAMVGKASVRVQPIPMEKRLTRTRRCRTESDNLFNSQGYLKILIIFFEGDFLDLEVGYFPLRVFTKLISVYIKME
jgi:hypothetical protein